MKRELLAIALLTLGAMACNKAHSDEPGSEADTARTVVATAPAASNPPGTPAVPDSTARGSGVKVTTGDGTKVTTTGGGTTVDTGNGTHVDTTGGGVKVKTGGVKVGDGTVVVPGVGTVKTY